MPDSDLILNVRQIAGYPNLGIQGTDNLLTQRGGIGGPYLSVTAQQLVSAALASVGDMTIAGTLTTAQLSVNVQATMNNLSVDQLTVDVVTNINNAAIDQLTVDVQANINSLAADQATFGVMAAGQATVAGQRVLTAVDFASLTVFDVRGAAPLFSPVFGGEPRAPTPPPSSCNSRLATTAFVQRSGMMLLDSFVANQPLVFSFNGRTGDVVLTAADIEAAGATLPFAPIDSPNFTGNPTAPTATPGTQDGQLATTAFVMNAVQESTTGVASFNGRTGIVVLAAADVTNAGGALLNSPVFTGTPQGPTAAPATSTAQLATTAFVMNALAAIGSGVTSFNGRSGAITLTGADLTSAGGALINSPNFSGIPTAATAAPGVSTTQLATCAFVMNAVLGTVASFNGRVGAVSLIANDISAASGLVNPNAAMTGAPTAPTAAPGTNSTQIATTAYVQAAIAAIGAGVVSFNTRTGAVTLSNADVIAVLPSYASAPAMDGTAAPGVSTAWARGDHVHPTDTSRYSASNPSGFQTASQVATALASYLPLSGGTLTGQLIAPGITSTSSLNVSGGTINAPGGGTIGGVVLSGSAVNYLNNPCLAGSGGGVDTAFGFTAALGGGYGALTFATSGASQGYVIRSIAVEGQYFGVGTIMAGSGYQTATMYGDSGNASWSMTPSDGRLKRNLGKPDRDALAVVNALEVDRCDFQHPSMAESEHWDFAVLADDVQKILPYAYIPAPPDGFCAIHPLHLITVLWKAVQQLSERLVALENPT